MALSLMLCFKNEGNKLMAVTLIHLIHLENMKLLAVDCSILVKRLVRKCVLKVIYFVSGGT